MDGIYGRGGHTNCCRGNGDFILTPLFMDNDFTEEKESGIREELYRIAEKEGPEKLHSMLAEVDPEYAADIHFNNVKRVARALECYRLTGEKMSEHNKNARQKESPYNLAFFVLNMDRAKLYERIDLRVDIMMKNGLESEVRNLFEYGIFTAACKYAGTWLQGIYAIF